jgi:hypothetical protein
MYNDRIAAALIEARHEELRRRNGRPRAARRRRAPRTRPRLPRAVFVLRSLRARS